MPRVNLAFVDQAVPGAVAAHEEVGALDLKPHVPLGDQVPAIAAALRKPSLSAYVFYMLRHKKEVRLQRHKTPAMLGLKHGSWVLAKFEGEHMAQEVEVMTSYGLKRLDCCATCFEPLRATEERVELLGRVFHRSGSCFSCGFCAKTLDGEAGASATVDPESGRVLCGREHPPRPDDVLAALVERATGTCAVCKSPVWAFDASAPAPGGRGGLVHASCLACNVCFTRLEAHESGAFVCPRFRAHAAFEELKRRKKAKAAAAAAAAAPAPAPSAAAASSAAQRSATAVSSVKTTPTASPRASPFGPRVGASSSPSPSPGTYRR